VSLEKIGHDHEKTAQKGGGGFAKSASINQEKPGRLNQKLGKKLSKNLLDD